MIVTLISITLLIVSIVCFIINKNIRRDWPWVTGTVTGFVAIIALIFCVGVIISTKISADVSYQNKIHEREMLEYRIDNMDENIVGNEMLYNDIVEFNNGLRSAKKWAYNPWVNWFYVKEIATIDYIEIDGK